MKKSCVELVVDGRQLVFFRVELIFTLRGLTDVFAAKNNKTLAETLAHRRYASLKDAVLQQYPNSLSAPLGRFLHELKHQGDSFYRRFLNSHGDKIYCRFHIAEGSEKRLKGLYLYKLQDKIVYIGRSFDPFGKRIDRGYGTIHPKNCYIDGQSTNCHLNSLIESYSEIVGLFVCPLDSDIEIELLERALIRHTKPIWNVALIK